MKAIRQRCTAKRTNGEPCKMFAIRGGRVCKVHGGMAPQVRRAAAERIKALEHPALDKIEQLIHSENDAVALATCKDILDRAGHKPKDVLEVHGDLMAAIEAGNRRARGNTSPDKS